MRRGCVCCPEDPEVLLWSLKLGAGDDAVTPGPTSSAEAFVWPLVPDPAESPLGRKCITIHYNCSCNPG